MEKACETCVHKDKSAFSATCVECGIAMMNYEHMSFTNADRIRAMTDEELDKFLGEVQWDVANYCGGIIEKQEYPVPEQRGAWLDWLRQEANDG